MAKPEDPLIQAINALHYIAQASLTQSQAALEFAQQLKQAIDEDKWIPLDEAASMLGSGISPDMLKARCKDGRFRHGIHFINTSDGEKGNYLVKVATVRKFFETEPEKRPLRRRNDAA